jgi:hypothetical protein
MRPRQSTLKCGRILCLSLAVLILAANSVAAGSVEKIVHSFVTNPDGELPEGGLVADSAGNLYGTTNQGASHAHFPDGIGSV